MFCGWVGWSLIATIIFDWTIIETNCFISHQRWDRVLTNLKERVITMSQLEFTITTKAIRIIDTTIETPWSRWEIGINSLKTYSIIKHGQRINCAIYSKKCSIDTTSIKMDSWIGRKWRPWSKTCANMSMKRRRSMAMQTQLPINHRWRLNRLLNSSGQPIRMKLTGGSANRSCIGFTRPSGEFMIGIPFQTLIETVLFGLDQYAYVLGFDLLSTCPISSSFAHEIASSFG